MIILIDNFFTKDRAEETIKKIRESGRHELSIKSTITDSVQEIIKEKFNSDVGVQFEITRTSPLVGHPWHYDGVKPEGVARAELDARYSEPWKDKKLVDNHAAMNAFVSILLLSDPSSYEGGELSVWDEANDKILKFRENHYLSLLIFPCKDVYQHMLTPITSGERFSHIAWYKEI